MRWVCAISFIGSAFGLGIDFLVGAFGARVVMAGAIPIIEAFLPIIGIAQVGTFLA